GGWLSAAELDERSRTVAGRFRTAGLTPGDRIVISASASVDVVVAHVAALRAGLVVVPTNTAYREREVAHIVDDARPAAAVVDDADVARWITERAGAPVVVCGPTVELADGACDALDTSSPGDDAMLCYTSGTTGRPKGARLTHGNVLASPAALALAWRWVPD